MYSQSLIVVLFSTLVAVSSSPIVTPNRDSKFLFRNSLIPQFHHWQQQQQQQQQFFYRTPSFPEPEPADPVPYDDYPADPWHQPEPEPEPQFTRFAAPSPQPEHPGPFVSTYSAFSSNVLAPSEHLQPPRAQQQPLRIFFLFSRFPWPLEPFVQRVQNYYSTYTVPQVEPLLDEEVDLGPEPVQVEEVDEHESLAALGNATTTPAPVPENSNSTGTRISGEPEESGDLKDELTTEPEEEVTTEAGTTTQSPTVTDEEPTTTLASAEQAKDEPTTGANEKNASATSKVPSLDYDGEIILA